MLASRTTWSADLSVGNDTIDAQRKELLESGQHVFELIDHDTPSIDSPVLFDVCDKILQVALRLFAEEENLLTWNKCPNLGDHQEQHNFCLKAIATIRAQAEKTPAAKHSMVMLLGEYLRNHMLVTDLRCKEYMRESHHHAALGQPLAGRLWGRAPSLTQH